MILKYIVQESDNSYILLIYLKILILPGYCVNTQEKGNELVIPGFITKTMFVVTIGSFQPQFISPSAKNGRQRRCKIMALFLALWKGVHFKGRKICKFLCGMATIILFT